MVCRGICQKYRATGDIGSGRYFQGQKRCQMCEIFLKWDGLFCPCCNCQLRSKPRSLNAKKKLRESKIKSYTNTIRV